MMNEPNFDPLEIRLREAARQLAYPPTPDLARQVSQRLAQAAQRRFSPRLRLAWVALALVLVLLACLAVPPVRAAVLEFLQVGAIRIRLIQPTPTPTLTPMPLRSTSNLEIPAPVTATEAAPALTSTPTSLPVLDRLAGETTLQEAERRAGFNIRYPGYPEDLGDPERVFFQELGGPAVLLLWFEPGQNNQVRLSLLLLTNETVAYKSGPKVITVTQVNGEQALWTEGEHILEVTDPHDMAFEKFLARGHVLIWTLEEVTYRLETSLDLEEAVRMAESMR